MRINRQRKAQIGIKAAFVKFVKQDRGNALKARVIKDHPAKYALCNHLNAGLGADLGLQPHAQAHRLTDGLAKACRHSGCGGAGGQTPGLQHNDLATAHPGLSQQGQRHARGLARAGRCDQNSAGIG